MRWLGTLLLATALLAGVLSPAAPAAQAADRTITYTVSTRGVVRSDAGEFAAVARATLADPRGWSLGGTLAFTQVPSGSDFDLILAEPAVIAAASPGCSAAYSCRVGRSVYINDERWRLATSSWPHGLALYRQYVILHEVGHWLGQGHSGCPAPGRIAWVMQQQSISLQGCLANVWPVIAEREQVGRRWGVPVAWSPVEGKYRAFGQEGGLLGAPATWERSTDDGVGRFQHYTGAGGASIFWHPALGAYEVYGPIRDRWAQLSWERGPLGYPATGQLPTTGGGGRFVHFPGSGGGSIFWSPATGAWEVYGPIRDRWAQLSWERGPLGYPTTGQWPTDDGVGRYVHFGGSGGGSIFWSPATGAWEVYGPIRRRWEELGFERGSLGYPVSGVYAVPGGSRADFQRGSIRLDAATGRVEVLPR